MPVDSNIALGFRPSTEQMTPQQAMSLQQLSQQGQMQQEQISEIRRKRSEENALREYYTTRDPSKPISLRDVPEVMKRSPTAGIQLQGQIVKQEQEQAQADYRRAQALQIRQKMTAEQVKVADRISGGSLQVYEAEIANGVAPEKALEKANAFHAEELQRASKSGLVEPDFIAKAAPQFNPDNAKAWREAQRPLGTDVAANKGDKEAPPTELKKLLDERDALPPGSARRKEYDDKIAKLNAPSRTMIDLRGSSTPPGDFTKEGADFLKTIPADQRRMVEALVSYNQDPKSIPGLGGHRETMLKYARQLDPNYDETQYANKRRAIQQFGTGTEGRTVRSLNVAIEHLDTLREASDALKNNNFTPSNKVYNEVAKVFGQSPPNTFEGLRDMVANEVVKGTIGTAGALEDRREAASKIKAASSPQQMAELFNGWTKLMGGQVKGLRKQYEGATGLKDFDTRYLQPRTRDAIRTAEESGKPKGSGGGSGVDMNNPLLKGG